MLRYEALRSQNRGRHFKNVTVLYMQIKRYSVAVGPPALCHLDWQERRGAITKTRPLEKKTRCERRHCTVQAPLGWVSAVHRNQTLRLLEDS